MGRQDADGVLSTGPRLHTWQVKTVKPMTPYKFFRIGGSCLIKTFILGRVFDVYFSYIFLQPCCAFPVWGVEQLRRWAAETLSAVCHREPQTARRRWVTSCCPLNIWRDLWPIQKKKYFFKLVWMYKMWGHDCTLYAWHLVFLLCLRFPEPKSPSDDREEDIRVDGEPGRLPPLSHDLRQLPEAAWLFQHRDHARETVDCGSRGPAVVPPFLISPHLTFKCLLQRLMKSWLPS